MVDHTVSVSPSKPTSTSIPPVPGLDQTPLQHALVVIHYAYPLILLFSFLTLLTWWGIYTSGRKAQPAWASPPITARSSPARGRSPNGSLINRNSVSRGGSDVDDEEDHLLGISSQGRMSDKGLFGRVRARFAAWFRGDLENHSDAPNENMGYYHAPNKNVGLTPIRKAILGWGLLIIIITYMANSTNIILHALVKAGWWCGQDVVISNISLLFVWAFILLSQLDSRSYPTVPHVLTWSIGLIFEIALLVLNIINYNPTRQHQLSSYKLTALGIDLVRIIFLLILINLYFFLVVLSAEVDNDEVEENDHDECESDDQQEREDYDESTGLLATSAASVNTERRNRRSLNGLRKRGDYGSIANGKTNGKPGLPEPQSETTAGWGRRNVIGVRQSWWEYLRGYAVFFPYLWPSNSRWLQLLVVISFILVTLQRAINILVPYQLGKVTDLLTKASDEPISPGQPPISAMSRIPWIEISLYIFYRFLQGSMGLLGAIRSTLWIPIGQYSYQALSTSAFEHVHSLSLDFHLGKKTGEVLSALSKGNAINNFLEMVTFQVVPMLVDLGLAVAYFWIKFDGYFALIVAIVTFCYLYITIRMAQWRADMRREMTNKSREEDAVKNDSMIAYETVKYFNAEQYEFSRYRNAVNAFQRAEYHVLFSLNIMNVSQNVMFMIGLLVACFLSAWQVTTGQTTVGQFVSLLAYLAQLQGPLNFFGTFYRSIQSSMINSERMLELFKEKPTVVDSPSAKPLKTCNGEISFNNVHFSYDQRKPALRGFTFTASPGTTTAFVGESGGGKTTILRLLFRFYNIDDGSITIDGHDVRDVTIDSLREKIGVVPQDTVLFNETIMYNLKYANANASDEMVYEACRAARIHDKIMAFPDQYNTRVGERGLRLSGGEKQRVAIARTILKNPRVILLDEATAALDSETEQHIQKALKELSKGRTTLVIAHRLSTITSANQILCIHAGKVVERGTHEELLQLNGRYAMMWEKQAKAEKQAREIPDDELSTVPSSSSSAAGGPSDLMDLSSDEPQAPVTIPRTQDEAVGINVIPPTPNEGELSSEGSSWLRRSASGTSLRQPNTLRWNTTGLRDALGKK
ncbi:hypothetical protein DFH27DRAFT_526268 [Peziza echinospora]|nr:hypothetical protein DFH27DRAFT_526268 [Peziza echinospora]